MSYRPVIRLLDKGAYKLAHVISTDNIRKFLKQACKKRMMNCGGTSTEKSIDGVPETPIGETLGTPMRARKSQTPLQEIRSSNLAQGWQIRSCKKGAESFHHTFSGTNSMCGN